MRKLALLTTIFVVLSAPTHAQDNATVQKLADQFAEAFNKNAASGVGDLYADDAVLVPRRKPISEWGGETSRPSGPTKPSGLKTSASRFWTSSRSGQRPRAPL
jgi:hypothetical protein